MVGEPIEEELTWLDHMEIREWLAGTVGEIHEEIELEMGRVTLCGDEGCAFASLLDWLIASIEDDVSEMDDCIRGRLSAGDRENSSPHRFEYEIGATPEARYDPSTDTYITLLDPLDVSNGSNSNLHEWVTHELTHHITYDPETGSGTEDHGEDFWDKYYAIRGATTSCRGG